MTTAARTAVAALSALAFLGFLVITWPLDGWRFTAGVLLILAASHAERVLAYHRGYAAGAEQGRFEAEFDASLR